MSNTAASPAVDQILNEVGFDSFPSHWSIMRIEGLLSDDRGISVGVMYPGTHDPNGIPLVKAGDLAGNIINPQPEFKITPDKHEEYRRTEFGGGEIVLSLVGDIGRCAIVPPFMRGWNSARATALIRLADPSDAQFVRLCFLSSPIQHLMHAWATTTVQATLNLKEIRQIPIPWPPKKERNRIADIFRSLDDKIELNRRTSETLETMVRALFKSWFVDFDPVREKAAGRRPVGLDAETARLFPSVLEGSSLGKVPKGWKVEALSKVVDINPSAISKDYSHETIQYVDISSVTVGRLDGTTKYTREAAPSRAKRLVRHGDTIWSCVRPNHRSYLFIHQPPENLVVSTGFAVLRPARIGPGYLFAWTTTDEFVEYLTANADGSAYPAVRPEHFARAPVLCPPADVVSCFERIVAPMFDAIAANQQESRTLADTRDSLLPKLLAGELPK